MRPRDETTSGDGPQGSVQSGMVRLRRVSRAVYAFGCLIAVVGTAGLIASVVLDHGATRAVFAGAALLWAVGWAALVVGDRQGAQVLGEYERAQTVLQSLAEARHAVLRNDDPRQALVDGALSVTGASLVMLSEVRDGSLVATASAGSHIPHFSMPLDRPSISRQVINSGQALQVADIHAEPAMRPAVEQIEAMVGHQLHSVAWVPIILDHEGVGVLTAAFAVTDVGIADRAVPMLTMLAQEAAVAIDRERLVARLHQLTLRDGLTGLTNRRGWDLALEQLGRGGAIALLDLDHFKHYNDTYGHPAGDRLLKAFGAAMIDISRSSDTVARIGGEEFAIATPDPESVRAVVDRLRTVWANTAGTAGTAGAAGATTFSVGIASRHVGESIDELQARCDAALYQAKDDGRDRVVDASRAPHAVRGPSRQLRGA